MATVKVIRIIYKKDVKVEIMLTFKDMRVITFEDLKAHEDLKICRF